MKNKVCDSCKSHVRHLRKREGKLVCWNCYLKGNKNLYKDRPMKFEEYLTYRNTIFIALTKSQQNFLDNRLKSLGLGKSEYFRDLVLNDMETLVEKNKK